MWISSDGQINTNAWASPEAALPARTLATLRRLSPSERDELADAVNGREFAVMEQILDSPAFAPDADRERPFKNQWIPTGALAPIDADSAHGILTGLERIDLRWRLDALQVLGAQLEELSGD